MSGTQDLVSSVAKLDLCTSTLEELQLANIVTRSKGTIVLRQGTASTYLSDDDDSDADEEDGYLKVEKYYHDCGAPKYIRTYLVVNPSDGSSPYERMVEEKHFDPSGVCRVDVHFALGQPYMYRKHYHPSQTLKSERTFFVEDERNMVCRKTGHWREYYHTGSIMSETVYDQHGIRTGFCKKYNEDGSIKWVKDYTKEHNERLAKFNEKKGHIDYTPHDAAKLLGFDAFPTCAHKVNSRYRIMCAPLHPDKHPDPEAVEVFVQLSRGREILLDWFEKNPTPCGCQDKK